MTPLSSVVPSGPSSTFEVELADLADTERFAAHLARQTRSGDVIGLEGPLGAGKTTFARGFIVALLGPVEVPSPTFTLLQTYERNDLSLWHFDLYRLSKPEDVVELGLEEALGRAIVLIEWPERLGAFAPVDRLVIRFEPGPAHNFRHARLTAHGPRGHALLAALRAKTP